MNLEGKKVLLMVEEMFNLFEFWYPYYRLKEAGAEVVVVAPEKGTPYAGKGGTEAVADKSAAEIDPKQFDGIVIPGGYAPDHMRRHEEMVQIVRDMYDSGKAIAAICHAGWMLASAKIVEGKTLTSFFAIKDDLIHAGAKWVDKEVVVDGKLITSRKPDDLPAFMKAFMDVL
jgi:protease I